jgi:outer membrane protein TolC
LNGKLPIGLTYQIGANASEANGKTDFRFNPNLFSEFGFTNNPTTNLPGGFRRTNEFLANAGLTAQQHLLKDAWIDADRTLIYVRRKEWKMSEQATMFQIMRTVLAVEVAYYNLIAAQELVRVEEKALELKDQFVTETRRRVQVGDLPPLDSEQAESQLELTRTALLSAREMLVSRQNTLKFLITDDFRELVDVDLKPAHGLVVTEQTLNRAESFKSALKNRPDLIEARLAIERSDVEIRFYRNQLFPNLDLFGHYGGLGTRSDGSSAVSDAMHFRDQEYYYGVILSFPLTKIKERADYQAGKAKKDLAELQLKRAEQEVFLQIADLVNRVESRFSQVGSTHRARAYAESALAAEQKKLQNGLSTSFVVLQLQEALTAARTAEVQAMADYNEMLAQLAFAEGATMQKHGLEFRWR